MTYGVYKHSEINADKWDEFISNSADGFIYHYHAYISHLCNEWQAVIAEEEGKILAVFPFEVKKKWGIRYSIHPPFSQFTGMIIDRKSENVYKQLEFEKKIIEGIHAALPRSLKYISCHFAPGFSYHLALQWLGWQEKTLYTYWADISSGYESFLEQSASHVRRELKKSKEAGFEIRAENKPAQVADILLKAKPFLRKQILPKYFEGLVKNAAHYYESKKSVCLIAYLENKPVAGIIYFFHRDRMVYYQGSTLPEFKNSGVMTHIICESVRLYGKDYKYLDFDVSMIEPIERYFRGFSAFPVSYFRYTLNRLHPLLKFLLYLKQYFKP